MLSPVLLGFASSQLGAGCDPLQPSAARVMADGSQRPWQGAELGPWRPMNAPGKDSSSHFVISALVRCAAAVCVLIAMLFPRRNLLFLLETVCLPYILIQGHPRRMRMAQRPGNYVRGWGAPWCRGTASGHSDGRLMVGLTDNLSGLFQP